MPRGCSCIPSDGEIHSLQVEIVYVSLNVPFPLYCNALGACPVAYLDRPFTRIHLAAVHLARLEKQRDQVKDAEVPLYGVMVLGSSEQLLSPFAFGLRISCSPRSWETEIITKTLTDDALQKSHPCDHT
ncbi:hypothetical protein JVT61DRAFT_6845 [Boletus reticuloceps]|uniref:Uncharacterized protein n=1 Tax=Boletus reticuloceps TaxID=495285 RepID=A0A8I3A897_9AGAM|nr:hypothetical protein JVT61DRAFT_6845 [Boletus reticuloceps]